MAPVFPEVESSGSESGARHILIVFQMLVPESWSAAPQRRQEGRASRQAFLQRITSESRPYISISRTASLTGRRESEVGGLLLFYPSCMSRGVCVHPTNVSGAGRVKFCRVFLLDELSRLGCDRSTLWAAMEVYHRRGKVWNDLQLFLNHPGMEPAAGET